MKRIIIGLLAIAVALGLTVAVNATSASAVPASACRSHNSTQNNQNSWEFNNTFNWHYTQWLYTTPGCNQIYFRSEGWRFDYYQCGELWVRRLNANGTTYVVDGSRKRVCGGTTVMLISRIAADRGFRVEGWSDNAADRIAMIWPIGSVRY